VPGRARPLAPTCRAKTAHRLCRRPKHGPIVPFRAGLAQHSPALIRRPGHLRPAKGAAPSREFATPHHRCSPLPKIDPPLCASGSSWPGEDPKRNHQRRNGRKKAEAARASGGRMRRGGAPLRLPWRRGAPPHLPKRRREGGVAALALEQKRQRRRVGDLAVADFCVVGSGRRAPPCRSAASAVGQPRVREGDGRARARGREIGKRGKGRVRA
jgi:hypothetical protein